MIYIVDIIIVLIVGVAGCFGWRFGGIRTFIGYGGLIGGIFVSAFIYTRLAFLAEQSWLRGWILVVVSLAVMLLSGDAGFVFGNKLQQHVSHKALVKLRLHRAIGVGFGAFGAIVVVWLLSIVPGRIGPSAVRAQIGQSVILSSINRLVPAPDILQTAAHMAVPFSSPAVFVGTEPIFTTTEAQSDDAEQAYNRLDSAVAQALPSVIKVNSWGCGSTTVGSGFLAAKHYIVTNAHVVAGADRISVTDARGGVVSAYTVSFDPKVDLAILYTASSLSANPLKRATTIAKSGSVAAILGYPSGGSLVASDAPILQDMQASGTDIYGKDAFTRHIYAVRATSVPGNSGGPLLNANGEVIGVVFGHSNTQNRTSYAIAMDQIANTITSTLQATQKISTGQCEVQ